MNTLKRYDAHKFHKDYVTYLVFQILNQEGILFLIYW